MQTRALLRVKFSHTVASWMSGNCFNNHLFINSCLPNYLWKLKCYVECWYLSQVFVPKHWQLLTEKLLYSFSDLNLSFKVLTFVCISPLETVPLPLPTTEMPSYFFSFFPAKNIILWTYLLLLPLYFQYMYVWGFILYLLHSICAIMSVKRA